ncbi:MAG: ABC transporter substrate-binding protein [Phycisphaerae bacterium]
MIKNFIIAIVLGLPAVGLLVFGPRASHEIPEDRVVVTYWEKWTLAEGQAIKRIVDEFNATVGKEKGIWVEYTALGDVDKRMLIAAAGGDPPDLAGLSDRFVPQYADQGALLPLSDYASEFEIGLDSFKPIWMEICQYDGTLYAFPSTPFTIALYYNKSLFRDAGLDPGQPPRTTAEFNDFAVRLTKVENNGTSSRSDDRITQLGFTLSPSMLGWWHWVWPYFFDGSLWDGEHFTLDSTASHAAMEWIVDYRERVGNDLITAFEGQGSIIESAQNPFLAGKLAMVFQGPWLAAWAERYTPDLDYGVAPFPSVTTARQNVFASCDVFVIPKGARHPREAMIFLQYALSQPVLEQLCRDHGKVSPFRKPADAFYEGHPNPYIRVFDEMATSEYAFGYPSMPTWGEAWTETLYMLENVLRGASSPDEALRETQATVNRIVEQYDKMATMRKGLNSQ